MPVTFVFYSLDLTLNLMNLESVLSGVTKWFQDDSYYNLSGNLKVPGSVGKGIQQQTSDATQQKKTLLERWLRDHPAPSWAVVAEALYQGVEHGVLEQVKKMYITGMLGWQDVYCRKVTY